MRAAQHEVRVVGVDMPQSVLDERGGAAGEYDAWRVGQAPRQTLDQSDGHCFEAVYDAALQGVFG